MEDEDGGKRVRAKGYGEVDWISNLPDCLICEVLLCLPTKDVVKTSVLSSRWRNLWKYVPGLNFGYRDFQTRNAFPIDYSAFLSFVDRFLGFNSQSRLQSFRLECEFYGYDEPEPGDAFVRRWINSVVRRKVKYLYVSDDSCDVVMPPTIYTCESLVSLTLSGLTLPSPKFVSLPSLKVLSLGIMMFADDDDLALETLISHGLEELVEDLLLVIVDAPRLKFLNLRDGRIENFILKNPSSLVKADIDTEFNLSCGKKFDPNDLQKRNMIRNFLVGISSIKNLIIASSTLEVIYDYSRCEPLPLFRNLSSLRVKFYGYTWEMLPIFLESCPNLQSLVMGSTNYQEKEGINILSEPRRVLSSSLKYVKIERPLKGEAMEMKLVSYILENSTALKKLTLCLDDSIKKEESVIFRELLTIPRLSTSCQVVVL